MYAWFKNLLAWPIKQLSVEEDVKQQLIDDIISKLTIEAARLPVNEDDELAVDWLNGRRTPDADQLLKGALINLDLASDAPRIFKALVEATCFGAKAIVDRFVEQGVPVKGLIGLGGVAKKSPYVMQVMADVMGMEIRIHQSEQTCAAGAAMFAATAAGIYDKVEDAMKAMGQGFEKTYHPDPSKKDIYAKRYQRYQELGAFVSSMCNE